MAGTYQIKADQGSTFNFVFTVSTKEDENAPSIPWDLSSYSARMQVKSDVNTATKFLNLTSGAGDITLDSVGTVTVTVSATIMATVPAGRHRYDIELVSAGGVVERILNGRFIVSAEVTN